MTSAIFGRIETWDELVTNLRRQRSVFLFDELGMLSSAVAGTFIPKLYLLAEEAHRHVRVIVTLPEPIPAFLLKKEIDDPKYQHAWRSVRIPRLDKSGLQTLLQLLPAPAKKIASLHQDQIMHLSTSHPRKVQSLCSHLFDQTQAGSCTEELSRIIYSEESYG